ncbi:MAG: hypothetical protein IT322_21825 [Anaerolineae bacterium]|nr:hypothetical protein [Anaerolineae bacterium]
MRRILLLIVIGALIGAGWLPTASKADAQPSTLHPRLWLTPSWVEQLRGWAVPTNPVFADGLLPLVERAKSDMDEGYVPQEDCGQRAYTEYPTESYALLFAFMAQIDPDPQARQDYAQRARSLLMHVIQLAALGPAAESDQTERCPGDPDTPVYPPFRDPRFFTEDSDRPRWYGEGFALTVDWIYDSLSADDKARINQVFTRWGAEIIEHAYHHPEPVGLINDPALLADPMQVRWAGNNYFTAHMRNLGMMALALDPADSSEALQGYLKNATGAWLYLFDALSRTEAKGGLLPEGFEYSPQTASYVIQFLLALKTAGQADPALHGPQVVLEQNPFWDDFVSAFLHAISPDTVLDPDEGVTVYQPAWYGDAQRYHLADFIDAFGALGLYDQVVGNHNRLNALRWIQLNIPSGGAAALADRVRRSDNFRSAILYFLLFDPAAPPPTDPRVTLPPDFVASGLQHLFSRTDWSAEATWLTYGLSWNSIDHQHADGNHIEFYRKGEWLTKARVGYANIAEGIASSEFRNTLAIQNSRPLDRGDDDWRIDLWRRGSQWNLVASGDPGVLISAFDPLYTYAAGDATNLYNSEYEGAVEVKHASRALIWLKPDLIIVYDRADAPAERFKRVWWQIPEAATITGFTASMTTAKGQQLFITALAPEGAVMRVVDPAQDGVADTVATGEIMRERVMVEAPAAEKARFVHVLQGADGGTSPLPVALIRSAQGSPFEGAAVNGAVILFPVDFDQPFTGTEYTAPAGTTVHLITGLSPETAYAVTLTPLPEGIKVVVAPAGEGGQSFTTNSAGVLTIRD